ncbi:MAG: sugar transporter, partial [bacterium]
MEEDVKSIGDYFSIGWRRKYFLIVPIVLLSALTIGVVKSLSPVYSSSGTILIESQQIPQDFIQSTV